MLTNGVIYINNEHGLVFRVKYHEFVGNLEAMKTRSFFYLNEDNGHTQLKDAILNKDYFNQIILNLLNVNQANNEFNSCQ